MASCCERQPSPGRLAAHNRKPYASTRKRVWPMDCPINAVHAGLGNPKYLVVISTNSVLSSQRSTIGRAVTHAELYRSTFNHAMRLTSSVAKPLMSTSKSWKSFLSRALVNAACTRYVPRPAWTAGLASKDPGAGSPTWTCILPQAWENCCARRQSDDSMCSNHLVP
eukprot:3286229-Karenia_brevis.AAC.1